MNSNPIVLGLLLGALTIPQARALKLKQPYSDYERERDTASGYPTTWANEAWPDHDHKGIGKFVHHLIDPQTGALRSEKDLDDDLAAEEEKKIDEWRNAKRLRFQDWMVNDWSGHKYITTHRCFGHPCKADLEKEGILLQLDAESEKRQPKGKYEAERDSANGYPHELTASKETQDFVKEYIEPSTGRTKLQAEVDGDREAKLEKQLKETYDKPAFKVQDWMVNDWTGHKYVTTHKCFGHACKKDQASLVQLQDSNLGTFHVGDMQEHRYSNLNSWVDGAVPFDSTSVKENVHRFVYDRFDQKDRRFKNELEVAVDKQKAADAKAAPAKHVTIPDSIVNDWTGHRFAAHPLCYGVPCDKEHVQLEDTSLVGLSADPYDPNWNEVDSIVARYKKQDAQTEAVRMRTQLGNDPRGGIDAISGNSLVHNQFEDDKYLKELCEEYSTGGKGPNGMPNRERVLSKSNLQLATEEAIKNWNKVSEGGLDNFIRDNYSKVWSRYDTENRGEIDLADGATVIREVMGSLPPTPQAPKNDGVTRIDVEPIVSPDAQETPGAQPAPPATINVKSASTTEASTNITKSATAAANQTKVAGNTAGTTEAATTANVASIEANEQAASGATVAVNATVTSNATASATTAANATVATSATAATNATAATTASASTNTTAAATSTTNSTSAATSAPATPAATITPAPATSTDAAAATQPATPAASISGESMAELD